MQCGKLREMYDVTKEERKENEKRKQVGFRSRRRERDKKNTEYYGGDYCMHDIFVLSQAFNVWIEYTISLF